MLSERLLRTRKHKRLTQEQLGKMLGVTDSAIGMWERGKRRPDPDMILRMAEVLEVSTDYLLGRGGRPYEVIGEYHTGTAVPFALGEPSPTYATARDAGTGDLITVKAADDAMIGSRIREGDTVQIETSNQIEDGAIYLIRSKDETPTLRRIYETNEGLWLISDNSKYRPLLEQQKDVRVIGRAIRVQFEVENSPSS